MAEGEGQERTEDPTAKRQAEARRRGQAPRSRDLNTVFMLLGTAACLYAMGTSISGGLKAIMSNAFAVERDALYDSSTMLNLFIGSMLQALRVIAPVLLVSLLAAFAAPLLSGSWVFSWESLSLQWSRMNPVTGLGRMFGTHGVIEMLKGLLKFVLLIAVAYVIVRGQLNSLLGLISVPPAAGIAGIGELLTRDFLIFSAVTLLIAGIDVPYQWWSHMQKLRMSRQEIKDEMRDTEGKPEVKSRIRRMQQEASRRRMMQAVPKADVIVTNPTHYAVALRYDATRMRAPRVVARGVDEIAMNIREIGTRHRVPTITAPPLARAIYYSTRLDAEIPEGLYVAVAQLLAYVMQLKRAGTVNALDPDDLPIPPELRRDT